MTRFLSVLSGALLVAVVALINPLAALPTLLLVIAGWWFRVAAVGAVLVVIGVFAVADAGVVAAAATGLVATTYLLNAALVHAPEGVVPTTIPSVGGAVLFTVAAAAAALVPVELIWAPLAAPVLIVLVYAILVGPLAGDPAAVTEEIEEPQG
ncbi:hypothetical protein [Nocardia thailandica]|uniref:hypothetical protein n=1 Tax=Nocardia thailandica TaxID=257275 RepID=UPI0002D3AC14|nr:hypothetical protein [Nocardia thailandica]